MILLLDTATPVCRLWMVEGEWQYGASWEAGRDLSKGLLSFLENELTSQQKNWSDVRGLVVYRGPGSFTGLRIGATVFNTLAYANGWPIVGASGDGWRDEGIARLEHGENDEIVLLEYGGEANITQPRK